MGETVNHHAQDLQRLVYKAYPQETKEAEDLGRSVLAYQSGTVMLKVQHEAAKYTRETWRRAAEMKLAWLYPTKVRKQL